MNSFLELSQKLSIFSRHLESVSLISSDSIVKDFLVYITDYAKSNNFQINKLQEQIHDLESKNSLQEFTLRAEVKYLHTEVELLREVNNCLKEANLVMSQNFDSLEELTLLHEHPVIVEATTVLQEATINLQQNCFARLLSKIPHKTLLLKSTFTAVTVNEIVVQSGGPDILEIVKVKPIARKTGRILKTTAKLTYGGMKNVISLPVDIPMCFLVKPLKRSFKKNTKKSISELMPPVDQVQKTSTIVSVNTLPVPLRIPPQQIF